MLATIKHSELRGCLKLPASKSITQRACILALLNKGITVIANYGNSNDEISIINAIIKLGAECDFEGKNLIINSSGNYNFSGIVNAGESGLGFRMLVPAMSLSNNKVQIIAEGSLQKRTMNFFEILKNLGVKLKSNDFYAPVTVNGPLIPKNIKIDASTGSQFLTGILFAFASAAKENIIIEVENLVSKPYVDISLNMLKLFSCNVHHTDYSKFFISPKSKDESIVNIKVESDWSNAAFFLVAGAICGSIEIEDLKINSLQGDKNILDVLKSANAGVEIKANSIRTFKSGKLSSFIYDATDTPDLFPPLAALAAFCNGTSVIKGVHRLVGKESNRAESLVDVFSKMGVKIRVEDNQMFIIGASQIKDSTVISHNDHRIVMAASIVASASNSIIKIENAESVNKSYPLFFEHLQSIGGNILLT
ncbi:MAG: 3-phosphoshikimate 1-carboxyvinyltransferase [Ferruginibacter sp.]